MLSFSDVFNRESRYPVFDRLCHHLSIAEIIALTRTCRTFSNLYNYLLLIQWDVDRRLTRFVRNPGGLRSQMGRTDALISGSFALQYFERVTWPASDLDIFVERGENYEMLCQYLAEAEGYLPTKSELHEIDYADESITMVSKFIKSIPGRENQCTEIHVFSTYFEPLRTILTGFYTTVLVNVLTWNAAYSVFPLTTFVHYRGYMLQYMNEYLAALVIKYTRRGWRIQGTMWPEDKRSNHPIQAIRRFGDRYTWKIPFDTRNVRWSSTPDSVLEYACFKVVDQSPDFYQLNAPLFNSHALRYTYIYHVNSWCRFLGERVTRLTKFELRKLKPWDQPPNYHQIQDQTHNHHEIISKPDTWTYWDHEIPRWYKAWEEEDRAAKANGI